MPAIGSPSAGLTFQDTYDWIRHTDNTILRLRFFENPLRERGPVVGERGDCTHEIERGDAGRHTHFPLLGGANQSVDGLFTSASGSIKAKLFQVA